MARVRLMDGKEPGEIYVPIPDETLRELRWEVGDDLVVDIAMRGDYIIVHKLDKETK